jgi:hypothetical protein
MTNLGAALGGVAGDGTDFADCALLQRTNSHACTFSKKASLERPLATSLPPIVRMGRSGS